MPPASICWYLTNSFSQNSFPAHLMTAHKSWWRVTLCSRLSLRFLIHSFQSLATSSFRSRNILTLFNKNKHYRFNDRWMFSRFPPSYWEFEPRKRHQVQRWSDWVMGTSLNCSHLLSKRILMLRWLVQNNQIQFVFLIIGRWLDCDILLKMSILSIS